MRRRGGVGVNVLATAMLAVGDVLEPRDRDEPAFEITVDGEPDDGDEPLVVWMGDSPAASYALIRETQSPT
ncbi:MAG TPA: hypothetical protein VEA78_00620 [Acidimicrobiales bacterium]|nr:hypothetical protein [Acidimicrobiales bacterium]